MSLCKVLALTLTLTAQQGAATSPKKEQMGSAGSEKKKLNSFVLFGAQNNKGNQDWDHQRQRFLYFVRHALPLFPIFMCNLHKTLQKG